MTDFETIAPRSQRVRTLYHWAAPFYDAFRGLWSHLTLPIERKLDRLFRERIGSQARILELAPGTGINLLRLFREAPGFASYLGIDASAEMLERARSRARGDARIALRLGDATQLDGLDDVGGAFDFIACTWLLSHLDAPAETVRSALARLAPGGTAVFVFFSRPSSALLRGLLDALGRVFRYRLVDTMILSDLPHREESFSCAAGIATLLVFRRSSAAIDCAPSIARIALNAP